jgi:hypothetical protein
LDQRQRAIKTSLLRCQLGLHPVNKAPSSSHFAAAAAGCEKLKICCVVSSFIILRCPSL